MFITFQPTTEDAFVTVNTAHIVSIRFAVDLPTGVRPRARLWPIEVILSTGERIGAYLANDDGVTGYDDSLNAFGALETLLGAIQFLGSQEDGGDLLKQFSPKPEF